MTTSDEAQARRAPPEDHDATTSIASWWAIMLGGPSVLLFGIYVFIQRVGTKSSRPAG